MTCPVTVPLDGRWLVCQNTEPGHRFHRFLRTQGVIRIDEIAAPDTPPIGVSAPPGSALPTIADPGGTHLAAVTERVLEHVRSSVQRQYGKT